MTNNESNSGCVCANRGEFTNLGDAEIEYLSRKLSEMVKEKMLKDFDDAYETGKRHGKNKSTFHLCCAYNAGIVTCFIVSPFIERFWAYFT